MRVRSIALACVLGACGSPRSPSPQAAPPEGDPPGGAPAGSSDRPCREHPCDGHRYVTVAAGGSHDLSTGETIAVEEVADGAVRLQVDGAPLALARRAGAEPHEAVGWAYGLRVELAAAREGTAWLIVHALTDEVTATETVTVRRGETVRFHGSAALTFAAHGHKHVMSGQRSPLLVLVDHHDGAGVVQHSLDPPEDPTWTWQDLRFTLGDYAYGAHMVLTVDRLALRPVE